MHNPNLTNKVAVVTGGTGVLGTYWCKALAECGAKVAILGTNLEKGQKLVKEIEETNGIALAVKVDVLNKESLLEAKKIINATFGPCDILINGAGGNHPKGTTTKEYFEIEDLDKNDLSTFFNLPLEGFAYVFNLNFLGTLLTIQVFAEDMIGKDDATIINISSMNAFKPLTKIPAYSAAKAAINNFTQWLAAHFAKVGIRVNAIAPGFFLTKQNESLLIDKEGNLTDRARKIISHTPIGRFGKPEELIGTLLYLVDKEASGFVTGVVIPVDGGFSSYSGV
ncbi:MAG: SDR family oxidoreductase [Bacilli bacterium]|nr:SDR family oxidoreductase [Bacilli bacterium]